MKKYMANQKFIVVGCRAWSKDIFDKRISKYPGRWYFIPTKKELNEKAIEKINPRYIFFLHWSWKVPKGIITRYECVNFHETDLPYGRGGSPIQNLIIRGHKTTKVTALRMTESFDAGPIYLKEPLFLEGRAEEIYIKASNLAADMIFKIINNKIIPKPQKGKVIIFKRRKPEESKIPECKNIQQFHDFIRMLDAKDYPRAFIKYGKYIIEFSKAEFKKNKIKANVEIWEKF